MSEVNFLFEKLNRRYNMINIDELVSIVNRLCDKKDVKHELLFDRMCGKLILHLYENNYHIIHP